MGTIRWMEQLLEVERRDLARRQLLQDQAGRIFEMLKAEVTRCIEEWNAAHDGGTLRVDSNAADDTLSILIPDRMQLTYQVKGARLDFEYSDNCKLPRRSATVELCISPTTAGYSPAFTIEGRTGRLAVPELVEHLLRPVLLPSELIARLPPSPIPSSSPDTREAERRRAAATQPLI